MGAQIEVECQVKGQGEGNGLPHAGQAKSRYWDTREDSPKLIAAVAILTDQSDICVAAGNNGVNFNLFV